MKPAYLYYDGQCPFCKRYSRFIELRKKIHIEMRDARLHADKIHNFKQQGYDIEKGMILEYNSELYTGHNAITRLNTLIRFKSGDRLTSMFLKSKKLLTITYPCIRILRTITLWILGIEKLKKKKHS